MKARVAFTISSGDTTKNWILHLRAAEAPAVFQVDATQSPRGLSDAPNVTLTCSDDTLSKMASGDLSPEYAYMRGWLQIKGQMGVAQKVKKLLADLK
jgi:putative sterol carrier protein